MVEEKKYYYSEIFHSIQGEGQYTGVPTAWIRFFLCNLQCNGFGQKDPTNPETYELPFEDFDVSSIKRVEDLPVWDKGCDSSYTWAKKFKGLMGHETPSMLADKIVDILKNERIKYDAASLQELRKIKDLYLIARIVVFQDPLLAKTFKEEAIFDSKNNRIYSQNEQYFLDPSSQRARDYTLSLAIETCQLGFNEIQFDYIRYPDSTYQYMVFKEKNNYLNRTNNINSCLLYTSDAADE